jgi:hypothetical protein
MAIQESTPTQSRAELPAELRPIAEQLLQEARIAVEKAVAHSNAPDTYPLPARGREPALEHVLAQRLKERPASHRKRAEGRVMPSVRANAASRGKRYGELAGIDLRSTTPIAAQAAKVAGGITLSPEALMASTGANDQIAAMQSPAAAPAAAPPPVHFTSLQLRLKGSGASRRRTEPAPTSSGWAASGSSQTAGSSRSPRSRWETTTGTRVSRRPSTHTC